VGRLRIVVTGATGLVGRQVATLLSADHDVWAVTRRPAFESTAIRTVIGDLAAPALPAGLPESADTIIHLAQSEHFRTFPEGAPDVFAVNVASTARLLDWAQRAGVRHFILASSGAVDHGASPASFYVASKKSAELLAQSYASALSVLVIRFFFVYGPGQRRSMLVPRLIDHVRSGTAISLAGGDGPRFNPVFVDDAARALVAAVQHQTAGLINIAGPDVLTVRAMADAIAASVGHAPRFDESPLAAEDLVGDISRMCAELVPPAFTFAQGVQRMLAGL
jgi:UDP-glucose 4-epimerase